MKYHCLDITLEDDLIFSLRSSTQGQHETLDRIPGTALWGWAAAWLHRHHPQQAVALAHEGGLRFSDARPLSPSNEPTWPTPLVLASDKGSTEPLQQQGRLQAARLLNLSHPEADPKKFAQAKGLRGGYVSRLGEQLTLSTRYRLRTAIDADTGTVAQGQLFGYDSLQAGQRFQARLGVADEADPAVVAELLQALQRQARLGRSRSGEYGRVRVAVKPLPAALPTPPTQGKRLVLWLLSDALLRDVDGRPCLEPDPQVLGLHGARFMHGLSALRYRSYSPWNAHRNSYGVERQVLVAGSVLVFERDQPFTTEELVRLQAGIGCEQAQGLGEVSVNPEMLQDAHPRFATGSATASVSTAAGPVARPDTPLMRFLARQQQAPRGSDAEKLAQVWLARVAEHLRRARRYQGLPPDQPLGPNSSQWGALAAALEQCQSDVDVQDKVYARVLGFDASGPVQAQGGQGRAGVHQAVRVSADWKVSASGGPAQALGQVMHELLSQHLQESSDWRAALREVVHACNELRRARLHLDAELNAELKKRAAA